MLDKTTAWLNARSIEKSKINDADFLAAFDKTTAAGANICVALDILQIDLVSPNPHLPTIVDVDKNLCANWNTARERDRASISAIEYPVANVKEAYLAAFDHETNVGTFFFNQRETALNLEAARNDAPAHFSAIVQLEDKMGNVENQLENVGYRLEKAEDQLEDVESQFENFDSKIDEIERDIDYNVKSTLSTIYTNVEELDNRVDALERVGSEDIISDLEERIGKLESVIAALVKALSGA